MDLINHPDEYREGTRTLWLKSRRKDGHEDQRQISRITHSLDHHRRAMDELVSLARPNERIYGSLDARDLDKAARYFKHAIVDEGNDPLFWRALHSRWESALMQPTSRSGKLWLWDCDVAGDEALVREAAQDTVVYAYATVSGSHIITKPFDMRRVSPEAARLRQDNAMMLWGASLPPTKGAGG